MFRQQGRRQSGRWQGWDATIPPPLPHFSLKHRIKFRITKFADNSLLYCDWMGPLGATHRLDTCSAVTGTCNTHDMNQLTIYIRRFVQARNSNENPPC